jgi:hypothetical protein
LEFQRDNPTVAVDVVLQRLVKSGQVKVVPKKGSRKAYKWFTAIDHIQGLLDSVDKVLTLAWICRSNSSGVQ